MHNFLEVPAVAGFQWYFSEGLCIGGEYRWAIRYITRKYNRDGRTAQERQIFQTGIYAATLFLSFDL